MGKGKINILILEDDSMIIMHLKNILRNNGYQNIHTARNHIQALALTSQYTFHILLADINIDGEIDGIDTAKILQKLHNLAVIFITAYNDNATLRRAAKVDFMGYLLKPFREEDLQTLLILILEKNHLQGSPSLKVCSGYIFDLEDLQLYKEAKAIKLTAKEQKFFQLVFNNLEVLITYPMIDEVVWSSECVTDSTRRTFIYRIKKKFPDLQIQTIKEVGIKVK